MHRIKIKIPVYDFDFTIIIDNDINKTIDKHLKKHKLPAIIDGDEYRGLALMAPNKSFTIFYDLHCLTPGAIVHEVCHMVDFLLEERDVEKVGESRAYITEHIIDRIFDYILKHNLLISKHLNFAQKNLESAPMAEGSKAGVCKTSQP